MSEATTAPPSRTRWRDALAAAIPAVLYGLRLSTGVGLALYAAFFLQLDNPGWAGTSAAIVAQPILGASLRKGVFRLIGTVIGATMSVVITAVFPQNRLGFFLAMALWCGACSFVSTVLRNFAAYAAMLAGYTLVIIASSSIVAPDKVFTLALARGSEIALGIVCGMSVMALTDLGQSPGRLAAAMAGIAGEIRSGLRAELRQAGSQAVDTWPARRALVVRVVALEPMVDQAAGESSTISLHRSTLRAGVNGLFLALSAWRTISIHLRLLSPEVAGPLAHRLDDALPAVTLAANPDPATRGTWRAGATAARTAEADSASTRLGLDRIASVLDGLGRAANALVLLGDPGEAVPLQGALLPTMPDILPPLINAARVFLALVAGLLFVVATAWDEGYGFLIFVAVTTLLLSPLNEAAGRAVIGFGVGTLLAATLAAVTKFALLPNHEGYGSFILIVGAVLTPLAALSSIPRFSGTMVAASMNFVPLLGPTNAITFDTGAFANSALGIVGGCLAGAVVLRVIPPVPPATRTRRLLARTLRDLRGAMLRPGRLSPAEWRRRTYGHLAALPPTSDPVDGSRLLAALTIGLQMMTVRGAVATLGWPAEPLRAAEHALGRGDVAATRSALARWPTSGDTDPDVQRAEAAVREIVETLREYADYFGARTR